MLILFWWYATFGTNFWNLEELYFSLPEGEVRFLKSACTNSHQPKKYFMSLFAMWDGKAWISHAQPMENPQKIQNHPLLVYMDLISKMTYFFQILEDFLSKNVKPLYFLAYYILKILSIISKLSYLPNLFFSSI